MSLLTLCWIGVHSNSNYSSKITMSICPDPTKIQEVYQRNSLFVNLWECLKHAVPHPKLFTKSKGHFVVQMEPLCYQTVNCCKLLSEELWLYKTESELHVARSSLCCLAITSLTVISELSVCQESNLWPSTFSLITLMKEWVTFL